jgi:hypothetical protein
MTQDWATTDNAEHTEGQAKRDESQFYEGQPSHKPIRFPSVYSAASVV